MEERLPSLMLLQPLEDTGAAVCDEEELTPVPAPGAFSPASLSEGP